MYRLVLLRHGESTWNKENRFTGWTDVGLTDKGLEEARQAAQLLNEAGFAFDIAFTSDLSPNWGSEWVQWQGYQAFVKQLMIEISRVEQRSDLFLQTFAAGDEGVILVEDYHPQESMLEIQAQPPSSPLIPGASRFRWHG